MSETPDHYLMQIQPIEFIVKNNIPFREANIIKYVCRHGNKGGIDDLLKAQHYLDMLIEEYAEEQDDYKLPTPAEEIEQLEKNKAAIIAQNKEWDAIVKACEKGDGVIIQEVAPGIFKRRESIKPDDDDIIN